MEAALARRWTPRQAADTPAEYLDRVATAGVVPVSPASRLTEVFREARFSLHPMGQTQRRVAEQALRELAVEGEDAT